MIVVNIINGKEYQILNKFEIVKYGSISKKKLGMVEVKSLETGICYTYFTSDFYKQFRVKK